MTNTIRLKITCFLLLFTVLLIKGILDLAWHLATRMKFGTCEQNWDLNGNISGLRLKFGTSFKALFLLFGFFIFRDQTFRNRDRDFFPRPNFCETETETFFPKPKLRLFSETETETFFRDQIFSKPKPRLFFSKPNFTKPKPSKIWQKFRNREVSKLKCQSLLTVRVVTSIDDDYRWTMIDNLRWRSIPILRRGLGDWAARGVGRSLLLDQWKPIWHLPRSKNQLKSKKWDPPSLEK